MLYTKDVQKSITGNSAATSVGKQTGLYTVKPTLIVGANKTGSKVPEPVVIRTAFSIHAIVYYDKNSAFLNQANLAAVQQLADELRFLYNPIIGIDGHASGEGSDTYNLQLSDLRRLGVISLLNFHKALNPFTMGGKGYGESNPVMPETGSTADEVENQRKFNRRVEINVIFDRISTEKTAQPTDKPPFNVLDIKYKPTQKDWERWEKEDYDRRLWHTPIPIPQKDNKSLNDLVHNKIDEILNKTMDKLKIPNSLKPLIRDGVHSAIEKGAKKVLDMALDQTNLGEKEKEIIKKTIEATGKIK